MSQSSRPHNRIARLAVVDADHRQHRFSTALPFHEQLQRARPIARRMILHGLDWDGERTKDLGERVSELLQANCGARDAAFLASLSADGVPFDVHDVYVHMRELMAAAYQIGLATGLFVSPDVFAAEETVAAAPAPNGGVR